MKLQTDLYLLTAPTFSGCWAFVCQLTEKIYLRGYTGILQMASGEDAVSLDQLLWTFRGTSFIPHQLSAEKTITVAKARPSPADSTVVINCRLLEMPESMDCHRLVQIVPNNPEMLQLARQHYRLYQRQGAIVTHKINC